MQQTDTDSLCGTWIDVSDYNRDINADLCYGDAVSAHVCKMPWEVLD